MRSAGLITASPRTVGTARSEKSLAQRVAKEISLAPRRINNSTAAVVTSDTSFEKEEKKNPNEPMSDGYKTSCLVTIIKPAPRVLIIVSFPLSPF